MLAIVPNIVNGGRPFGIIEHVVTAQTHRRRGLARAVLVCASRLAWLRHCYKVVLLSGAERAEAHRPYDPSVWSVALSADSWQSRIDNRHELENELLTGGCLCGAVTYEVRSPFLRFAHCHCSRCRKATGTGHATNLYCAPERFTWLTGENLVTRYIFRPHEASQLSSVATVAVHCPTGHAVVVKLSYLLAH